MAIGKKRKSTTAKRRKSGAPKRKRKARVGAGATITVAGIGRFKESTCHKTKTDAKKAAKNKRARGAKARVLKSDNGYCVYTRGRAAKRA